MELETKDLLRWLLDYVDNYKKNNNCSFNLFILGDWFHHNNPRFDLLMWTLDYFFDASKIFDTIFLIPGNHDFRSDGYCTDFLDRLNIPNFFYINMDKQKFQFNVDGHDVFFIPFFDPDKSEITYDEFIRSNYKMNNKRGLLLGHLYDRYAKNGSESDVITKKVYNIRLGDYSDLFHTAISGHIHTHQTYNTDNISIIYPGSMQCFTGHDINKVKKILIFSFEDDGIKTEWVDSPTSIFIEREFDKNDTFSDLLPDKTYVIYINIDSVKDLNEVLDMCSTWRSKFPNIKYINLGKSRSNSELITLDEKDELEKIVTFKDILMNNCTSERMRKYMSGLLKLNGC